MSINSLAAFPDYPRLLRGRKQRVSKSAAPVRAPAKVGASLQPHKGDAGARSASAAGRV